MKRGQLSCCRIVNVTVTKDFDVFCGRPTRWSNPFIIGRDGDREVVIMKYRRYLRRHPEIVEAAVDELSGCTLGCFCVPKPCHVEVLVDAMEDWMRRQR